MLYASILAKFDGLLYRRPITVHPWDQARSVALDSMSPDLHETEEVGGKRDGKKSGGIQRQCVVRFHLGRSCLLFRSVETVYGAVWCVIESWCVSSINHIRKKRHNSLWYRELSIRREHLSVHSCIPRESYCAPRLLPVSAHFDLRPGCSRT